MKNKRGKEVCLDIKLHMSKAYDKIEWSLILEVLKRLGFASKIFQFIKECLSLMSYTLLVNGSIFGNITPSRGLRHGDPLSLYLLYFGS